MRRIVTQCDAILAQTVLSPYVRAHRATNISGGAIISGNVYSTNQSSSSSVEIRTPINEGYPIQATIGDPIWQSSVGRMHSAIEQQIGAENYTLPELAAKRDFILRPGESLVVRATVATVAGNPQNSRAWVVQCNWQEDPLDTFAISGVVTLGGSPVAGAIVTVIEADDLAMTNKVLVARVVTDAGGAWSSSITTGKVGAAYVQYETGGTFYTAPGSPFLQ